MQFVSPSGAAGSPSSILPSQSLEGLRRLCIGLRNEALVDYPPLAIVLSMGRAARAACSTYRG